MSGRRDKDKGKRLKNKTLAGLTTQGGWFPVVRQAAEWGVSRPHTEAEERQLEVKGREFDFSLVLRSPGDISMDKLNR